ncbi:hypothetical protein [Mannheimia haemolytica]|nr:hypothetical protein [Mannheimia haemolytica]
MTQATMGKAKLLGLDKQVIDHTSSDDSLKPQIQLTEGEFREIALELLATV